jgi:hypothetical protein
MAINFSNSKTISEVSSRISVPGRMVQSIMSVTTTGFVTSSTSPRDWFVSNPITLTNASNIILVEWHSDNRVNDWGDGVWNLYYMDIIHVQSGTQLAYSGYRGELTYSIRHFGRSVTHQPGSTGPHSYKVRGWCYSTAQTSFGTGGDWVGADPRSYIRLTEIAV